MLTVRMTSVRDYCMSEDGQRIGRIRFASERTPGIWLWHRSSAYSRAGRSAAASLDEAKQSFKTAWLAFKAKHGPEALR
jgi:hypothetical protein